MITLDTTTTKAVATSTTTLTLNTSDSSRLIVIAVGWVGNTTAISTAPSATGLTFTRVVSQNGVGARLEIWAAFANAKQTGVTVTITVPPTLLTGLAVVMDSFTGAISVNSTASANVLLGNAYSCNVTTAAGNSLCLNYAMAVGSLIFIPNSQYQISSQTNYLLIVTVSGSYGTGQCSNSGQSVFTGYTNTSVAGVCCALSVGAAGMPPFAFCSGT